MDKVRFGRALGAGARQAAKTLKNVAEAAAAPDPSGSTRQVSAPTIERPATARTPGRISMPEPEVVKTHARSLKRSVWKPLARFSGVLWLEVTGTFFAVFAVSAGLQVWKWHAAVHLSPSAPDAQRLYIYAAMFALFAYFAVTSFVRANRRGQR